MSRKKNRDEKRSLQLTLIAAILAILASVIDLLARIIDLVSSKWGQ